MKSENFIVIQGWMCNELELKGNDLLVYALIYGFSQDGESVYSGGRNYIAKTFNISLPTVDKSLKNLQENNLIEKISRNINNVIFNDYKVSLGVVKKLYEGGSKEILHNNILDIKEKNKSSINTTTVKSLLKKPTLYEKASILIHNFTEDKDLQEALFRFLDLQIEISRQNGKQYYINVWKSRLNKLKSDFKEEEWLDVVKQATEKGWQNFYPLKENGYVVRYNTRLQDIGVTCERATPEELAENHRRALEREKNGKRGIF